MKAKELKKRNRNEHIKEAILWLPVFLLFCILPFFTYYKLFESRLSDFDWTPLSSYSTDFYLYYKQCLFLIVTGICFLLSCYFIYKFKKTKNINFCRTQWNMVAPLGIYVLFALMSSLFSEYKWISFTGSNGQFESFFALAGYVVCFTYLLLLLHTENDFKGIELILGVLFCLSAFLGLMQLSGHDLMKMEWFQRLITPKGYLESGAGITTYFEETRVSLLAFNPNYAGVFLAFSAAFCFALFLTETKCWKLVIKLILFIALFLALIGTGSRAGLLTCCVACVAALVFVRKRIIKRWYIFASVAVVLISAIALFVYVKRIPLLKYVGQALSVEKNEANPLRKMVTDADGVHFTYRDISFTVAFEYEDGFFDFKVTREDDSNDSQHVNAEIPLILSENREVYYLGEPELSDVSIRPGIINEVIPAFSVLLNGREWMFIKMESEENRYFFLNQYLKPEILQDITRLGFHGYETFASCRGLIWSMTFPLLKDSLLLGTGADTFACYYPQNNYKDLYYYTGDATATTRPHSMYLKIAVETGIPSLIALLVFWGWYLVHSFRIYWHSDFSTKSAQLGFACFIAVIVYLVCGLTNDSMITVAPVFWGICGVGVAANRAAAWNHCSQEKTI